MKQTKKNPDIEESSLAADSMVGADDAAGLPARLNRYSMAHHRALDMAHYARNEGEVKISQQLDQCGAHLLFRDYYTVGKVKLKAANFCRRHLLCPLCAIRRGAKALQIYLAKLEELKKQNPNLKAYMITLTVKDGSDLQERFEHLHRSVQKLHKYRHIDRGYQVAKSSAAVWSYEFKRGKNSGDWHPHVHAVWLCEEAPDYLKLRKEWQHITKDSKVVHVQPFYEQDDLINGFLEVFKYAVKFSDLPLEDNWHGFQVLKGRRLISSFGDFYGLEMPDDLTDDQLEDQPFVEMLFRFVLGVGYNFERFIQGGTESVQISKIIRQKQINEGSNKIDWHARIKERGITTWELLHLNHRNP